MDPKEKKISQDIASLFQKVQAADLNPAPYMETRVLAELRARQSKGLLRWRQLAMGTSVLSVALAVGLVFSFYSRSQPYAFVGEPFAVRLQVEDLKALEIVRAEIQLPPGIEFEHEDFPELKDATELTLAWTNRGTSKFVPFLLKGSETGVKVIVIRFFDSGDHLVAERKLSIRLKEVNPS